MSIKTRLKRLEDKKNTGDNGIVVLIDDVCTYNGREYTKEEFNEEFPEFKNAIEIVIE